MNGKKYRLFVVLLLSIHVFTLFSSVATADSAKPKINFIDIKGHWAEEQILALIDKGIVKGASFGNNNLIVNPEKSISRAEIVTLMVKNGDFKIKNAKIKQFTDVKTSDWFKHSIDTAVSNGFINGYPDNSFKPDEPATRAEIASLITSMMAFSNLDIKNVQKPYKDVYDKDWYYKSVVICKNQNIIKGYEDGLFLPKKNATRAEAFAILYNARIAKEKSFGLVVAAGTTENDSVSKGSSVKVELPKPPDVKVVPTKTPIQTATPTKAPTQITTPTKVPDEKQVSRGELQPRVVYDLKPAITIDSPFTNGSDYFETKDITKSIEGSIVGNIPKTISFSVSNENGKDKAISVVEAAYPKIGSVVRDVYTAKIKWQIELSPLKDDLNIITMKVVDVYGNTSQKSVRIMRVVDSDGDGLSNYDERKEGTNTNNPDTDGDGLNDYIEVKESFTDALNRDTDGDGLTDYDEVVKLKWKTSPTMGTTIGNNMSDKNIDVDGDGISNYDELYIYKTDPLKADTDGDGLPDGVEVFDYLVNPTNIDSNNNGADDFSEVIRGTVKNNKTLKVENINMGLFALPPSENLDTNPIKLNDKRAYVVLKIQYLINRLLTFDMKDDKCVRYTGEFDMNTRNALVEAISIDEVNDAAYNEMVKRVNLIPASTDTYSSARAYLTYAPYESILGIKHFKERLEMWREQSAQKDKSLYTVLSLLEKDGSISTILDEKTSGLLKIFQLHQGIKPSGEINDKTAEILLDVPTNWNLNNEYLKADYYIKESFGKDMFYRYSNSKQIPLNPVYYSQLYGQWSNQPYYAIKRGARQNERVVARNGCGPTSTAMVIATLVDRKIDPGFMARFSMENDCITSDYNTEGSLYKIAAKEYGLKYEYSSNIEYVKNVLKDNLHLAIASMGGGHFTTQGHLIALMGVIQLPGEDFERIIVYDSNTGNSSYTNDGTAVFSNEPGIVYAKPAVLGKEQALGFFILWK